MLAYFNHLNVPGVRDVVVFRDHADPHQFYLLNNTPRIATDAKTGMPLFNFTLFSRNIEIAYASAGENEPVQSQLGALNMTVDLSIPESDMTLIRTHLTKLLRDEAARPSEYNKLYRTTTRAGTPRVDYVTWLTGTVKLDMLEGLGDTFKRSSSEATVPTLTGTNRATLWATFGSEGAQLMWECLKPKDSSDEGAQDSPVQANITFNLEGLSRVPGLRVTVEADGSAVYKEIRKRMTVRETVNGSTWTYPQISELVKELKEERVIEVNWDDYGIPASDPATNQIKQQLEQSVLGIITNQIVTLFFKAFELQGLQDEDLGETFTHTTGGKKGSRLWLNEFREEFSQHISFTLNKAENFRFPANPQTSLLASLTEEQREQLVKVVDVGSPEIQVMTVPVYTNADFAADKIANITATLTYKQFDTLVNDWIEKSESFVFRTGQEAFPFRTRLARDSRGRLIDKYDAKAQINYIGTSQSPPAIELKGISDRALTFSYDRLGYVKVVAQAGDVDWGEIQTVFVDFIYEAASNMPDAKKTIKLDAGKLEDQWTTSKHGRSTNQYSYQVRYLYKDGRESSEPRKTDDRGMLPIHDTLIGRLRRNFDVIIDPATVTSVLLKIRYEAPPDPPEEIRHIFSETGSWEFVKPLREGAPSSLKYAYDVQYADGQFEQVPWTLVQPDDDLPPIKARRFRLNLAVDGGGLDWAKWRLAVVELTYRDDAHDYLKIEELRVTKEEASPSLEVHAFSPSAREYEYKATMVPLNGGAPVEIPPDGTTLKKTGMLLLETLV